VHAAGRGVRPADIPGWPAEGHQKVSEERRRLAKLKLLDPIGSTH
jgi:hypothetical protein